MLTANRFDFVEAKTLPASLDDTQLVVFNNINLEAMRPADKQRTEEYVQSGGGALLIAGEHNVYVDRPQKGAPRRSGGSHVRSREARAAALAGRHLRGSHHR